jgi:hypothetical protein
MPLNIYEFCENQCSERHVVLMGINEFLIWAKFGLKDLHIMLFGI